MNLSKKEVERLVNRLRQMMLYQTPTTKFTAGEPDYMVVAFKPDAYRDIMDLINRAGGWTLPPSAKEAILKVHETKVKNATGGYDLSSMALGDLYVMHKETDGVPELLAFHEAISSEIHDRHGTSSN